MQTADKTVLGAYASLMLEQAPVGMALFEAQELRLLAANTSFQSLLEPKWLREQARGQRAAEILTQTTQIELVPLLQEAVQTGTTIQKQASTISSSTGEARYWQIVLQPLSEQDQVHSLLLTATEITPEVLARKNAEQELASLAHACQTLEQERQRLEDLETILLSLHHNAEPKALGQAVLNALQTCCSPQWLALYSAPAEQESFSLLAAHTSTNLSPDALKLPLHISLKKRQLPVQVMQQQTPLIQRRTQRQDRSREDEIWFARPETHCVVFLPLWRSHCEGVLILAFANEKAVTDRLLQTLSGSASHLAETLAATWMHAALADEKQRLHTILDQLPEGVLLVEARTSKVSYANPAAARLLGFTLPAPVGTPLNQSALRSPYGLSKEREKSAFRWNFALIDALRGKTSTNQEFLIIHPDGREVVVLSSAAPIRRSHGFITEAVIVFQDITAPKQLEQQKNTFFAVANHELRTPLTIIMGFAELLAMQEDQHTDAMSRDALKHIREECDHLLRLVQDLLDVSRLEQTQLEIQLSIQDLLVPLTEMVNKQIQATSTHPLSLTLQNLQPDDVLLGWFDLSRLEQVVRNLITNAVKYSSVGSAIEVGVCPCRNPAGSVQEVLIWVKDQGIGIASEDRPHLFERFYRAGNIDRSSSGFGIGLYLTKELVQAHGGRIWVESTLGQGSTFFVALPLGETCQAPL